MDNNTQVQPCSKWLAGKAALYGTFAFTSTQNVVPMLGAFVGRQISNITHLSCCTTIAALTDVILEQTPFDTVATGTCISCVVAIPFGIPPLGAAGSYLLYRTLLKAAEISFDFLESAKRSFSPLAEVIV